MATLRETLGQVDTIIAGIDRRLGFLEGRLYAEISSKQEEVPIFKFVDLGLTNFNWQIRVDSNAHRYRVWIDRAWWTTTKRLNAQTKWFVKLNSVDSVLQSVYYESGVLNDEQTYHDAIFAVRELVENVVLETV